MKQATDTIREALQGKGCPLLVTIFSHFFICIAGRLPTFSPSHLDGSKLGHRASKFLSRKRVPLPHPTSAGMYADLALHPRALGTELATI